MEFLADRATINYELKQEFKMLNKDRRIWKGLRLMK